MTGADVGAELAADAARQFGGVWQERSQGFLDRTPCLSAGHRIACLPVCLPVYWVAP